ncbi:Long chain base biosynthesis protein 1b [Camellia lanceoleosa]|uniref:Long chain base biosynthesis protein 1b n=1 Tax=Camellia lanceoleosa TaxID=1840588 RepID=A0ACC0FND9_9ERIC|nr:Long chain base biosynthesis protein 1b [Camellia lanceoleosa]
MEHLELMWSQCRDHLVLKEDLVFVVTSKRSTLDKCCLPVRIRLFISAAHSESDLRKASESLKRVAAAVLAAHD